MSNYLGIDPGKTGGIAVVSSEGQLLYLVPCGDVEVDTIDRLKCAYSLYGPFKAYIERVASFPGQGVSSTFTFGVRYGVIRGVLSTIGIPFIDVPPQTWQKTLGLSQPKQSSKDLTPAEKTSRRNARRKQQKQLAYQMARQLYPNDARITLENADGVLLAECCKRSR
jgi:hypothetical protein